MLSMPRFYGSVPEPDDTDERSLAQTGGALFPPRGLKRVSTNNFRRPNMWLYGHGSKLSSPKWIVEYKKWQAFFVGPFLVAWSPLILGLKYPNLHRCEAPGDHHVWDLSSLEPPNMAQKTQRHCSGQHSWVKARLMYEGQMIFASVSVVCSTYTMVRRPVSAWEAPTLRVGRWASLHSSKLTAMKLVICDDLACKEAYWQ